MSSYIPDDKIAEIKESCNIVQLIAEYVPLKKAGTNYRGACPFHSEKEPSFIVSEGKQIFHCFGCGSGGNVFTFLMKFEHLSFPEAAKKLAQKCGITLPQKEISPTQKNLMGEKEKLFKINEFATEYYSNLLNQT
ncbi:MAG: DNA primase, partial [Deltaproteobacteria bacterium]|nr:DNA primase [Deltaproteobacteria bacterium]